MIADTIFIDTNLPEFINDISEEIKLFLPTVQFVTESVENAAIVSVKLSGDEVWRSIAKITDSEGSVMSEYTFERDSVTGDEIEVKRHKKRCVKIAVFRAFIKIYPDAFVPWGSLTGIRPTKLLRELESEMGEEKAHDYMTRLFDVSEKKYALAKEIVDVQRPIIGSVTPSDIDVYIGIPYCRTRCLYCSFASDIRTSKTDMSRYINALKEDIIRGAKLVSDYGYNVRTMYMGGGTPTVLTESELFEVLECTLKAYGTFGQEFTVEAGRPDTITHGKLKILRDFGVKRISINPQTANQKTLELIGRSHTVDELTRAYECAKELGFDINMDIITCLPGEGVTELENTLRYIESLRPENLTVHTLALKRSSKLKQVIGDEHIASLMPDAHLANSLVERASEAAYAMGMHPYYMYRQKYMRGNLENTGYALPGKECVYNTDMMEETVSIMAHGAGSMSKRIFEGRTLRVERIPNPKDINTYVEKLDKVYEQKEKLFYK